MKYRKIKKEDNHSFNEETHHKKYVEYYDYTYKVLSNEVYEEDSDSNYEEY